VIESGKTVKVHYKGTLEDGSVFDSSEGRDPLEFKVGVGQVISGFDNAVQGMSEGETKTVKIPSAEAYGDPRDDMIAEIPQDQVPDDLDVKVGQTLQFKTTQGNVPVQVIEVNDESIKVDANHPLAGQNLTFELTLVDVAG